ncbi:hypothetical protein DACRYDRAFT_67869 [Dacryopinax primogenitus]|uniref:Rrp15p-domain-containing protein n=1 Tax=Dacryopinax primogenitus (strain DJM 731) TaxID=1858805 RepID=M5G5K5_DACPD|nr:uncharacterized protein DACRYDRAFT_67869 [Dacryopinax primogenitus]EJU01087.1 hypothetical protein DACRYDRAFT_67869 [Dacryopinax primogenitus]
MSEGEEGDESGSQPEASGSDSEGEGTEEEIDRAKAAKSKKTKKRKLRATSPSTFGVALSSLLEAPAPTGSADLLTLKPSVKHAMKEEKLEKRAREILKGQRKEKEAIGHVTDVIGGWGNEGERALRKVAQRGVVKLFNAIQASQNLSAAQQEAKEAQKGSGQPRLPAPSVDGFVNQGKKKKQGADNIVGRAKEVDLSKEGFLAMIRGDA